MFPINIFQNHYSTLPSVFFFDFCNNTIFSKFFIYFIFFLIYCFLQLCFYFHNRSNRFLITFTKVIFLDKSNLDNFSLLQYLSFVHLHMQKLHYKCPYNFRNNMRNTKLVCSHLLGHRLDNKKICHDKHNTFLNLFSH